MFYRVNGNMNTNPSYQEILKLDRMLTKENIPHTLKTIFDGWQVCYPVDVSSSVCVMDAVEHYGSFGKDEDKLEIMGLLTPEEEEHDTILGYLTADEVFERIKKHHDGEWDSYINGVSVEDDKETPWLDDDSSNEYLMTTEEFAKAMKDISDKLDHPPKDDPYYDEERAHMEMDGLMADLLRQIGYGEGIDIFENTYKWYT